MNMNYTNGNTQTNQSNGNNMGNISFKQNHQVVENIAITKDDPFDFKTGLLPGMHQMSSLKTNNEVDPMPIRKKDPFDFINSLI